MPQKPVTPKKKTNQCFVRALICTPWYWLIGLIGLIDLIGLIGLIGLIDLIGLLV